MLTDKQRELRRNYLGASDLPAIFGMSPWRTAEDVRLIKSKQADEPPGNLSTEAGIYLEPAVRQWAQDKLGPLTEPDTYIHPNGFMCANLDAETADRKPVEIKTSGIVGPIQGNWGSEGTADIPDMYYVQVMCQIACMGNKPDMGYLVALLGGRGFVKYEIQRDDALINAIEAKAEQFWKVHVIGGEPAPKSLATMDVLKRVRREAGLVMPLAADIWDQFDEARRARLIAESAEEDAKRRVLGLIGAGEAISVNDQIVATFKANAKGARTFRVKELQNV